MPSWLASESLPTEDRVRQLIDVYFARVHSVRCLGFLHVPTFTQTVLGTSLQQLEPPISGLVAIMCALAAPFFYGRIAGAADEGGSNPRIHFFDAGRGWAAIALKAIFLPSGNQGIETLMTQVLLHDYYLRVGDYAQAFLVSGMVARHFQLLQLSLEYDTDITCRIGRMKASEKETRRRVAWACYVLDALIECGVDQLRFISASSIQVQLPSCEDLFARNIPAVTETISPGQTLPFVDNESLQIDAAAANLDLRAYYIRAVVIRSKILRYVKHLQGEIPWEDTSQFAQLCRELHVLENSIPAQYAMTQENTCLLKMAGRLNLYFGLHILLAQTYNDLYRVGVSRLVFPHTATKWIREHAPAEFLRLCHHMCLTKAVDIATWLQELWRSDKETLVDLPYAVHAQICSSVLVTSLLSWAKFARLQGARAAGGSLLTHLSLDNYRSMLETNVQILAYMKRYFKAELFYESATQALKQFTHATATGTLSYNSSVLASAPTTSQPSQSPPQPGCLEYILNPLGTYPMARSQVLEPHGAKAARGPADDSSRADVHLPRVPAPTPAPAPATVFPEASSEFVAGILQDGRLVGNENLPHSVHHNNNVLDPTTGSWETELQLMMGSGYPTFMDEFSTPYDYGY
ncbi:hypothetical protein BJY01DRAFT_251070 [Aspergillus pseudoustus]|uniref:Xylanolytic transcriptional activator regulatory domain-containing protein n=1 Tax=Aspergillus pseudoustus TaxID=1810923 RepID=A0ABR4JEG8_9EURO